MPTPPSRSMLGLRTPDGLLNIEGCEVGWAAFPALDQQNLQTIVCLHDIGSGSREFQPLLERQPANSRLVVFDWPNHGSSDPLANMSGEAGERYESPTPLDRFGRILHSVLHQLNILPPVILLGSGFGAAVAIRFASAYPSEVLGIAICQPAGLIAPKSGRQSYSRGFWATCFRRQARPSTPSTPEEEAAFAAHRQSLRLEAIRPTMRPLLNAAQSSLQQSQSALRTDLVSQETPILFALSKDNHRYPLRSYIDLLDPLIARSPQHRITVFTGDFHPVWDEPSRFAQAINGFVQSRLSLARHHHAWLLTTVDYPAQNMNLWKCVHPECSAEQALLAEANPNAS